MTGRSRIGSVVAVLALVTFVGCSGETDAEDTSTSTTTVVASGSFEVATPDGQVSLSLDGDLPPGWPDDFPLPADTEPSGSGSLGDESSAVLVGVFTTTLSGPDAFSFYVEDDELELGAQTQAGKDDRFVGSAELVSPYEGSVTVLSREGSTYVVVLLGQGGGTTTTKG